MTRALTVGFVAPSSFIPDPSVIERASAEFQRRGWQVLVGQSCSQRLERFAGSDALRAQELQAFCTDPSLDLVVSARGGYGLTRLLGRLDFDAIFKANRVIVGYSDFTAFNLAYLAQCTGISLHGPSAGDFGAQAPHSATLDHFFKTFSAQAHSLQFDTAGADAFDTEGVLWGGNLAMVCALLGTPYFPDIRGGILFLEDVNEPAYKIERMLLQLLQAGVLQKQHAILLGAFEPLISMPNDHGYTLQSALAFIRDQMQVPMITGLPFGHVPFKVSLPVGVKARLQLMDGQASLSWLPWRKASV